MQKRHRIFFRHNEEEAQKETGDRDTIQKRQRKKQTQCRRGRGTGIKMARGTERETHKGKDRGLKSGALAAHWLSYF